MDDPMQSIIEEMRRERMSKSVIAATRKTIRSESPNSTKAFKRHWASASLCALTMLAVSAVILLQRPDDSMSPEAGQHVQAVVDTIQSLNAVSDALVTASQRSSAILVSEAVIPWKDRFNSAKEKLNQAISNNI